MSPIPTADNRKRPAHSKKRRIATKDLQLSLEIIGKLLPPLPAELPVSPPASRLASPAPPSRHEASSSKRKLDDSTFAEDVPAAADGSKRSKSHKHHLTSSGALTPAASSSLSSTPVAGPSSAAHTATTLDSTAASFASHAPQRRSEVVPPPADTLASTVAMFMPVRRPRRGKRSLTDSDKAHDMFHTRGRTLKFSGDARFRSTHPPNHKYYNALTNPPPVGSPYHTLGITMSKFELLLALVCFVRSLWEQDYSRDRCSTTNWTSVFQFLDWTKGKWSLESSIGVREKMFIGLIAMIEAFIYQRIVKYKVFTQLGPDVAKLTKTLPHPSDVEKARLGTGSGQQQTPGMLPSPAGTASTNGTPNTIDTGTPNPTDADNAASSSQLPAPTLPPAVNLPHSAPVPQPLLWDIRNTLEAQHRAAKEMVVAQQHLTLAGMREHFPRTFGRMVYSTLTAQDEHEPDMDDNDGELFWPGQCVTGEGLGWLCCMGAAMIKEYGDEIGFKGLDGIITKPDELDRVVPRS